MSVHDRLRKHWSAFVAMWLFLPSMASMMAAEPPTIAPEVLEAYEARIFAPGETGQLALPYQMMSPIDWDSKSEPTATRYPLVLFLHGAGERGDDNQIQLVHAAPEFARPERRKKHPAFIVCPQCPKGKRWVESPWDLPSGHGVIPEEPSETMERVLALVDHLTKEYPIDLSRIYVTGLSMGGQGSWYAAVAPPQRFAAMLEVCGGGDPTWADRYQGTPIWGLHGDADPVVPISRGREMIAALVEAGHHPEVRYTEYPGVGHNSWTQTFARDDVHDWLFRQTKK